MPSRRDVGLTIAIGAPGAAHSAGDGAVPIAASMSSRERCRGSCCARPAATPCSGSRRRNEAYAAPLRRCAARPVPRAARADRARSRAGACPDLVASRILLDAQARSRRAVTVCSSPCAARRGVPRDGRSVLHGSRAAAPARRMKLSATSRRSGGAAGVTGRTRLTSTAPRRSPPRVRRRGRPPDLGALDRRRVARGDPAPLVEPGAIPRGAGPRGHRDLDDRRRPRAARAGPGDRHLAALPRRQRRAAGGAR